MAATVSLMIIPTLFQAKELNNMKTCNFDDDRCLKMYPDSDYLNTCNNTDDLNTVKVPATQYYFTLVPRSLSSISIMLNTPQCFRHKMMKYDVSRIGSGYVYVHKTWLIHIAFVWVLIFIFAVLGIQRIRKITVNLQLFWGCVLFFIALVVILNVSYETYNPFIQGRGRRTLVEFGASI